MNDPKKVATTEKPKMTRKKRIIIAAVAVVLLIAVVSKVSELFTEFGQIIPAVPGVIGSIGKGAAAENADLKPVKAAVGSSTPRVTSAEVKKTLNGFSVEVDVYLTVADATPVTQEELLAVLTALWRTVPFEPDAVTIRADTESDGIVDVKSAANMLSGVKVLDYSEYTATIQQLDGLLGPWKKPS